MPGTVTTDLTTVDAADALTNWLTIGTWATTPLINADMPVQGTNCVIGRVSANTAWELAAASAVNLTTGNHVFTWRKNVTWPGTDTKANGGITVCISSDATPTLTGTSPTNGPTNSKNWNVGGSDTDVVTGWTCYVFDPNGTADLVIGTPNVATVNRIGGRAKLTATIGSGNFRPDNIMFDAIRYGTSLIMNGGTSGAPAGFADFYSADSNTTNAYGIITQQSGIYFLAGKLKFGTAAQSAITFFADTNRTLAFQKFPVNVSFYELALAGASGFITTVQFGSLAGSVASDGVTIQGADNTVLWTLTASDANSVFKAYASTFLQMKSAALNAAAVLNGCSIVQSGTVTPNGATITGCNFETLATAAPISAVNALVINSPSELAAVTGCQFINCNHAIKITAAGTYTMNANLFSGNTFDIENASTGLVTINAINGSTPSTFTNTNGGTTVINNSVTLTLTGLVSGSNLDILAAGTSTVLANQESSGTSFAYTYSFVSGTHVDIVVYDDGYVPFTIRNYLLSSTPASLPISQVPDRNYVA